MTTLFTDAFKALLPEEQEAYHRAVFMQMDTPGAAELRRQYYGGLLRHMGKNVRIGAGVKFVHPEWITLGDHVNIDDHCTLVSRSERGITLGASVCLKHGVYLDT